MPAAPASAVETARPRGTPRTARAAERVGTGRRGGPAAVERAVVPGGPLPGRPPASRSHLDNFEGPFDLLLGLISKHKLDVTEIALARVTDEFVAWIRARGPDWDLDETSEFLLVAATLLDLKAARLLPRPRSRTTRTWPCSRPATCCSPGCCSTGPSRTSPPTLAARMAEEAHRVPRAVPVEPRFARLLPELVLGAQKKREPGLITVKWAAAVVGRIAAAKTIRTATVVIRRRGRLRIISPCICARITPRGRRGDTCPSCDIARAVSRGGKKTGARRGWGASPMTFRGGGRARSAFTWASGAREKTGPLGRFTSEPCLRMSFGLRNGT